jgi:alpha-L-arabinofuranosidase
MQGTNDPTVAVGMQLLTANIAEHKVLMFVAQAMLLAQQMGMPIQDENVQAQISAQLVQISAASNPQAQGPTLEQQMVQMQGQELQLAAARIQSQDTREAAKIALKNRELDLKETNMLLDAENKTKQNQINASAKILDNSAKLADIQAKRLAERANTTAP